MRPDEGRVDPEVLERRYEQLADPVRGGGVGLRVRLRLVQHARSGRTYSACSDVSVTSKSVGGSSSSGCGLTRSGWCCCSSAPTTSGNACTASSGGVAAFALRLGCRRGAATALPGRGADGVMRTAEDGADGGAREQQAADDERENAENRRAGTEQRTEAAAEDPAEKATMRRAERRQEPERRARRDRRETGESRRARCARPSARRRRRSRSARGTQQPRRGRARRPTAARRRCRRPSRRRARSRGRARRRGARGRRAPSSARAGAWSVCAS